VYILLTALNVYNIVNSNLLHLRLVIFLVQTLKPSKLGHVYLYINFAILKFVKYNPFHY